jgi:hypothetical protein
MQPLEAVARDVHGVTGLPECFRKIVARDFVIFHYQDVHGSVS